MKNTSEDLKARIDEYLDGTIDAEAIRSLEDQLRQCQAARDYFVRYSGLHADLFLDARMHRATDRALAKIALPERHHRRAAVWSIGMASGIFLATFLGWWLGVHRSTEPAPESVAWLVNAQDCEWADGQSPEEVLKVGTVLNIERGLAEIRFRKGTHVVMSGPVRLELLSDNSARLHRGRVTARVPEPAIGFELHSPQGKIIDLGTEFGVAVGDDGSTEIAVFKGEVVAMPVNESSDLHLHANLTARLVDGKPNPPTVGALQRHEFVRSIVLPAVIRPKSLTLDFKTSVSGTLLDRGGQGTGFALRLPGTGGGLPVRDPNLRLNPDRGLEMTTTNSDINLQVGLRTGEYFGLQLADLGFTGKEDFEIAADFPHIPALRRVGQFGVYAGTKSDRNIRGGLISKDGGEYQQNLVNNDGGNDTDSVFVGLSSTGDDMRVILKRIAGKYALTVENRTRGSTVTLTTKRPAFLDPEPDLQLGVFGANTQSNEPKTLAIRQVTVTIWKPVPADRAGK
jgi:FecR protein